MIRLLMAILTLVVSPARVCAGSPQEPVLMVLPALLQEVNCEMEGNRIPWFNEEEGFEISISARLSKESTLVKTIKGDYSYTLYRFVYEVGRLIDGKFPVKELSFYVERQFPTPESGIKFKELWPFYKDRILIFKLTRGSARFRIVSIEQ